MSDYIAEEQACATCGGRGVWMDEPCSDCPPFGWYWPDWVPAKVREQVESFYIYHGGHEGWLQSAEHNGAPELGAIVTLRDGFGSNAKPATGRFVFAWNNIARLVRDDGSFAYTSFHPHRRGGVHYPSDHEHSPTDADA